MGTLAAMRHENGEAELSASGTPLLQIVRSWRRVKSDVTDHLAAAPEANRTK
jgi:hypothetical protein